MVEFLVRGELMRLRTCQTLIVFAALTAAAVSPALGQAASSQASPVQKRAEDAYQAKDWPTAAKAYGELAQARPQDPRSWYRLAVCLRKTGDLSGAKSALEKSAANGAPPMQVDFEEARLSAARKDKSAAFEWLTKALDAGFAQPDQIASDEDLVPLRDDSRFAGAVERAKKNQKPCAYAPENRQFDFWVGEWKVEATQGGNHVGDSKIELILGDCVVLENWTGMGGGSGKSFNIYDKAKQRWEQYWVDDVGGMIYFFGGPKNGVMDYYTEDIPQPDGAKLRRHLQFFNQGPDKVRQFSQGSTDAGKTWTVEYDLTYLRKK